VVTVQQDEFAKSGDDVSPDRQERIEDFLARHGGPSSRPNREEELDPGIRGWYEIYATDGFKLRCDWSCFGSRKEMKFAEIPPQGEDTAGVEPR
jgi:hypothetical protein